MMTLVSTHSVDDFIQFLRLAVSFTIHGARARFVKKPVPGSELHGERELIWGMGAVRKPVPGLNPGSKSSPAWCYYIGFGMALKGPCKPCIFLLSVCLRHSTCSGGPRSLRSEKNVSMVGANYTIFKETANIESI